MPRPRLRGCTSCRERHLRCDRATPACSNCAGAKHPRKCVYGDLKIRHSTYSVKFRGQQNDEAGEAARSAVSRAPGGWLEHGGSVQARRRPSASTPAHGHMQSPSSPCVSSCAWEPRGTVNTGQTPNGEQFTVSETPSSSTTHASHTQRTITTPLEKQVFQFYLEHAGPWLDIASSHQHFSRTVPQLALREPVLYFACLAYSSHLLLLHGMIDAYVCEQFQDEAITILIPLLSPERDCTPSEALLSTAVILRMSEQFSELTEDAQHHLHGAFSLFTTVQERWAPASIDIRGVAFWTYVRESIRVCFLNEKSFVFNLDMVDGDISKTSARPEGEVWANHMSYLLAKLCNACWGDSHPDRKDIERGKVCTEIEEWKRRLPDSFQPWYHGQDNNESFPVIKFINPWHELAWQQFYTAKVMLAIYGFRHPVSAGFVGMTQYLMTEILDPARMVCSICFSSSNTGCNINGSHLVAWCGQFFTGKEEQRLVANFLKTFMDETKWPNQTCYERLQQIWNGKRSTWKDP